LFEKSTTASECCDDNQGRFNDRAPTMNKLDAFERELDEAKEALASKLAVILLMECEARIDDWSDRELMSRLALVLSLEEGSKVVEDGPDDGGVDSKLAVISLALIEVDADESAEVEYEDIEVFAMLDVAVVVAAAAAAATLWAAQILFCLL
jgi:hypothetical protein